MSDVPTVSDAVCARLVVSLHDVVIVSVTFSPFDTAWSSRMKTMHSGSYSRERIERSFAASNVVAQVLTHVAATLEDLTYTDE